MMVEWQVLSMYLIFVIDSIILQPWMNTENQGKMILLTTWEMMTKVICGEDGERQTHLFRWQCQSFVETLSKVFFVREVTPK